MAKFRYAVFRMNAEWRIVSARRCIGRYPTSEAALATLRNLAQTAVDAGHQVELLMQGPAGGLSPIAYAQLAPPDVDASSARGARKAI